MTSVLQDFEFFLPSRDPSRGLVPLPMRPRSGRNGLEIERIPYLLSWLDLLLPCGGRRDLGGCLSSGRCRSSCLCCFVLCIQKGGHFVNHLFICRVLKKPFKNSNPIHGGGNRHGQFLIPLVENKNLTIGSRVSDHSLFLPFRPFWGSSVGGPDSCEYSEKRRRVLSS